MNWPRATARISDRSRTTVGEALQSGVRRQDEGGQPVGSGGRGLADLVDRAGAVEAERAARGPDERPEVGRAADRRRRGRGRATRT